MSRAKEVRDVLHLTVHKRYFDAEFAALARVAERLAVEVDELRGEEEARRVAEQEAQQRAMLRGGLGT